MAAEPFCRPAGLVVAGAVQEVEDGILVVLRVTRRRVDYTVLRYAADGLGVVLDRLDFPRSIPSRRASKPAGAAGSVAGG